MSRLRQQTALGWLYSQMAVTKGDRIMENINEIARLIQRGMESSATATRAVMQAIQLGYTLAEMEHQEKKAG